MPTVPSYPEKTTLIGTDLFVIEDVAASTTKKVKQQNIVLDNQIVTAKINDNAVTTVKIADSQVTPAKLIAGTGTSWAWPSWTPTWTNVTVGNGTVVAKYTQIGKSVLFRLHFTLGSTSAVSGRTAFSLPVTAVAYPGSTDENFFGLARFLDFGTAAYVGVVAYNSTALAVTQIQGAAGTYVNLADISSTVPFTWTTNDVMAFTGFYESA